MADEEDEPFVDPAHLMACLRCFVEASHPATAQEPARTGGGGAADAAAAELGWEEAGCLVWDAAAFREDAEYLLQELPELAGLLAATLAASAAADRWRALEICLGIVGNLARHDSLKRHVLQHQGLPELLVDKLLWLDDALSLAECCRCLASILYDSASDRAAQDAQSWWERLLRDETLGRLVWIVENTLNSWLLAQSLKVLTQAVEGASTAAAGRSRQAVVQQLLSLDLLPLLESVLTGWLARTHGERQVAEWDEQPSSSSSSAAAQAQSTSAAHSALDATAEASAASPSAASASQCPQAVAVAEPAAAVVAAEVSDSAMREAQALLEALMADPAGEQALNAAGPIACALARMITEAELRCDVDMSIILLASMDLAGPQLLRHPLAAPVVLDVLDKSFPSGCPPIGNAELAEACWALLSALAGELDRHRSVAGITGAAQHGEHADKRTEAADSILDAAAEMVYTLALDWGSFGPAVASHQSYVLRRLAPLLPARRSWSGRHQRMLEAAVQRCRPAPP